MNRAQTIERIQILEELTRRKKERRLEDLWRLMYDWQHRFNAATRVNLSSLLMAANQVGKTQTGCIIDGIHLTGRYPDGWEGHAFDSPILAWLLGFSYTKTRDLLQKKLFGEVHRGQLQGGWIPQSMLVDEGRAYKSAQGTQGAVSEVAVKWGGDGDIQAREAICQFWSYSQGQHALMGDVVDWFHIDEEPRDAAIYPQVLTRMLNGDKGRGGRGILTLTPENGKTELVTRFMDEDEPGQYMQTATWDDAPHLSDEAKEQILAAYPAYQRDMRSRGVPLMGAGLIFEYAESEITCKRFPIPKHYFRLNAMDFGWDHPQAHVHLAIDPETAVVYVVHAWKKSKKHPFEAWAAVKDWAKDHPTAWPHDGNQHEKGSGKQQKDYYEDEGWNMLEEHSQWPEGGYGVEAGLLMMNDLFQKGKLKIFDDLDELIEETREYHRKQMPSGLSQIVKIKDDLLDAVRTGIMSLRFAEQPSVRNNVEMYDEQIPQASGAGGY